jgi:hypothetical protein
MAFEIGIASLVYRIVGDVAQWVSRKRDPAAILRHRSAIKADIEANLRWVHPNVEYGEAIVRDVRRMDSYPEVESPRRGLSPWFKIWVGGLYYAGLEVRLGIRAATTDSSGEWRLAIPGEDQSVPSYLVGRIPFDTIVHIDWGGDEFYRAPHIYTRFSHRQRPYQQLVLCAREEGEPRPFYHDLVDYNLALKRQQRRLKNKGLTTVSS